MDKFCIDCKYFRGRYAHNFDYIHDVCIRKMKSCAKLDLIHKNSWITKKGILLCRYERECSKWYFWKCGQRGKFWEHKETNK